MEVISLESQADQILANAGICLPNADCMHVCGQMFGRRCALAQCSHLHTDEVEKLRKAYEFLKRARSYGWEPSGPLISRS